MSNHNQPVSLGDVVRYMAEQALKADDRTFHVPIHLIARQVYGLTSSDIGGISREDLEVGGRYSMSKLKASYVANTVARMPEIQAANVRAKLSIKDGDFGDDVEVRCAYLSLVDGAIQTGKRVKANGQIAEKAVSDFKVKILKLMPSVTNFEGDEITGAIKAIKMYQEMIMETK